MKNAGEHKLSCVIFMNSCESKMLVNYCEIMYNL